MSHKQPASFVQIWTTTALAIAALLFTSVAYDFDSSIQIGFDRPQSSELN